MGGHKVKFSRFHPGSNLKDFRVNSRRKSTYMEFPPFRGTGTLPGHGILQVRPTTSRQLYSETPVRFPYVQDYSDHVSSRSFEEKDSTFRLHTVNRK